VWGAVSAGARRTGALGAGSLGEEALGAGGWVRGSEVRGPSVTASRGRMTESLVLLISSFAGVAEVDAGVHSGSTG
jgi:hypothetical protein